MSPDNDREGRSQLHYAALEDDVKTARTLLVEGEDVDRRDRRGFTPLHFAAQARSVDVARLLLDSGAEVDPTNEHGNTPLWTAVFNSRGAGEVIVLLRGRGADPFARNKAGNTPYDLAMLIDNYDIGQFFKDLEDRG